MVPQLRALVVLAEVPGLIPAPTWQLTAFCTSSPRDPPPFFFFMLLWAMYAPDEHTYMQASTHAHKIKENFQI